MLRQSIASLMLIEQNFFVYTSRKFGLAWATLLVLSALAHGARPEKVMPTTLCKIFSNPDKFAGSVVRIRAQYFGPFEVSALSDPSCDRPILFEASEMAKETAIDATSYPQAHEAALENEKDWNKFYELTSGRMGTLGEDYDVFATFTGRLDHCKNLGIGADGLGNCFGDTGRSEFRLVVWTLSDVTTQEKKNALSPTRSKLPDKLSDNR